MCRKLKYKRPENNQYTRFKKPHCEECGFVAVHPCQLDVHHVDENHENNNPENLKTVCANCHRLIHKDSRRKHDYPS